MASLNSSTSVHAKHAIPGTLFSTPSLTGEGGGGGGEVGGGRGGGGGYTGFVVETVGHRGN